MKHYFHALGIVITVLCIMGLLTQSGCKENTLIKSKVLPANDTVGVTSYTLSCVTHTYYDDTAITSTDIGGIPDYQGVGTFYDPFFGTITGTTYFQLSFGDYIGNPFTGYAIDSAILILPYGGFTYGDSTNQHLSQTYQVFYLLDTLGNPAITNYYSYNSKPVDLTNPLSDPVTVNLYQLKDSFSYNVLAIDAPALRVKLRLSALMKYLNPALNLLSTSTNLPGDFFDAFHGICVMPTSQANASSPTALPYFQLDGTTQYNTAGILIYYHDPTLPIPAIDTTPQVYNFDPTICAHFNNITRSYKNYPVNGLLHSTSTNDSIIVLENQPGASLDIMIPGIKSIPKGVIINNAQLQINLLPAYNAFADSADLPERMYPTGIGSATYPIGVGNGVPYTLADRYPITSLTPLAYMDGYWHYTPSGSSALATTTRTYTINLPREVIASIAANNDTLHLHIDGTEDFYGAFKMVAAGGTYHDPALRPKFVIVYSKIN